MGQINRLKRTVSELQEALREAKAKQKRLGASVVEAMQVRNRQTARIDALEGELKEANLKAIELLKNSEETAAG